MAALASYPLPVLIGQAQKLTGVGPFLAEKIDGWLRKASPEHLVKIQRDYAVLVPAVDVAAAAVPAAKPASTSDVVIRTCVPARISYVDM